MKERTDTLRNACKDFEEDLVLYYYGDDSEAEHSRVEGHLQSCAACHAFLDDLRKLLPQMVKPAELPESFWDNYHREMVDKLALQEERKHWWRNLFVPTRVWMLPAFGTAVVAALAIGLVIGKESWHSSLIQPRENIPQEILADTNQLEFFKSMDMLESLSKLEALDGTKPGMVNSRS